MIYLLAATSWILAVLVALHLGLRFWVKYRSRRRRIRRFVDLAWLPIALSRRHVRTRRPGLAWCFDQVHESLTRFDPDSRVLRLLADARGAGPRYRSSSILSVLSSGSTRRRIGSTKEITKIRNSRVKMASAERRSPHWNG